MRTATAVVVVAVAVAVVVVVVDSRGSRGNTSNSSNDVYDDPAEAVAEAPVVVEEGEEVVE